ncbi:MAG: hypothetical protein H7A46_12280 [Verrucomicrobiales bacterium]|nr:hypothetical protein [Verrucomicrobiales bacterium]
MTSNRKKLLAAGMFTAAWLWTATPALAHCDTLDGPVVVAAKVALEKREITAVLKWIKPEHEAQLRTAFTRTLVVRTQSREARELADQFFFETLVRLHRAGEGAPFTGLKPAGTEVDPTVAAADEALESGNPGALIETVTEEAVAGIRQRFEEAVHKKQHAEDSVEAGREYVAAYVEFVHYVEALHSTAIRLASAHQHVEEATGPANPAQEHGHSQ